MPCMLCCAVQGGPRMTWKGLTDFQHCDAAAGADCSAFRDLHPSTISMSVLVIVEMFNALNALSGESWLPPYKHWGSQLERRLLLWLCLVTVRRSKHFGRLVGGGASCT